MNRIHKLILSFCLGGALFFTQSQPVAALIFSDTFDSETVGNFPSTWSLVGGASADKYVTNNISSSAPNSFQIGNPHNLGYEVARFFPTQNLASVVSAGGERVQLGYSMAVTTISDGALDGNAGWTIALGLGSPGGFAANFSGGSIRVFSDAGSTTSWRIYDNAATILTNNLPLTSFFDVFVEITPIPGNETQGTVEYKVNGNSLGIFAYNSPNIDINGIRIDSSTGTGLDTPYVFALDNVFVNVIPEPSSAMTIALGAGLLGLRARRRSQE